jgi:hypothetical protein
MPARFTPVQTAARREQVSALYLQGWPMRKIAAEVGVNHTQVFFDIKIIRAEWRANTHSNFEEKQNLELARIDQIEHEAWKVWQELRRLSKKERHRLGDMRPLQTILECVRRRCDILGLNAPIETRITGRLSIDDLRAILEDEPIDIEANEAPPEIVQ